MSKNIDDFRFISSSTGMPQYDLQMVQDPLMCDLIKATCIAEATSSRLYCLISVVIAVVISYFAFLEIKALTSSGVFGTSFAIKTLLINFPSLLIAAVPLIIIGGVAILALNNWKTGKHFDAQAHLALKHKIKLIQRC